MSTCRFQYFGWLMRTAAGRRSVLAVCLAAAVLAAEGDGIRAIAYRAVCQNAIARLRVLLSLARVRRRRLRRRWSIQITTTLTGAYVVADGLRFLLLLLLPLAHADACQRRCPAARRRWRPQGGRRLRHRRRRRRWCIVYGVRVADAGGGGRGAGGCGGPALGRSIPVQ